MNLTYFSFNQGVQPMTTVNNRPKARTPQEAKGYLYAHGYTVKQWAEVLNGERKGLYGRGHEIAVKLGIKIPLDPNNL